VFCLPSQAAVRPIPLRHVWKKFTLSAAHEFLEI